MLDVLNLPTNPRVNQQIFYAGATVAANTTAAKTWIKPRGVSFVQFFVLGGGAGGGSGVFGTASTAAGGGGGGSGAQTNILFPAWALPDTLYMSVGYGGAGGNGVTALGPGLIGSAGIASYVSLYPLITPTLNTLFCFSNGGAAGTAATGATAGGAGAAGAITTLVNCPLAAKGISSGLASAANTSLAGQSGTAGGTTGVGTALAFPTTGLRVTGGTGGGGCPAINTNGNAGGALTTPVTTPANIYPPQIGGLVTPGVTANGNPGSNGFNALAQMLFFYGGTGGSSSAGNGGIGGAGGAGYYGCGGGGGGGCIGGTLADTSGAGGRGGDGLIIATAW